jgi:hypothetical protein
VRDYYQRMVLINTQELPRLPPFGNGQSFGDSDLIDILLFATPKKWQREMDRMGFDPLTHSSVELLIFMENCELMEDYDKADKPAAAKKPNNSKKGMDKGAKPADPKKQKWCENHGWSNHTTADCNQNKPGFKKGNKPKGKAFGNKTNAKSAFQRKNDEATKTVEASKELNAFMKKTIQQAVRQEVKSYKKKAGNDLNMVEAILSEFNYNDMENMQIDSDDDRKIPDDLNIESDDEVTV